MHKIWEAVKSEIKGEVASPSFSLWIDPISLLGTKDGAVTLACPNKFSRNWVAENYFFLIQEKLRKAGAPHSSLILKVASSKPVVPEAKTTHAHQQLVLPTMPPRRPFPSISLNCGFTFDRFVVGPCNEFAYSVARALAQGGVSNYSSLFVHADTGLGKSHLSQAIANHILQSRPGTRVLYLTAEDFTNELIISIKNNCVEQFKNKYRRACDVLLLEEIPFLGGKQKIQTELGYTLDALENHRKQIIFTSSLPPKEIPNLSKDLSSRLTSGLLTEMHHPDYDTRVKILTRKAVEHNLSLSPEIIAFVASRIKGDVRQMESALNCIKARAEFLDAKIDLEMAKAAVDALVSNGASVTVQQITDLVCTYYKIDPASLSSKSKKKAYTYPRNIYVYLCRRYTDETLETIGNTVNRTHSTVLYAAELVEQRMKTDEKMRRQVDFLSQKLKDHTS